MEERFDGDDRTTIVAHQLEVIVVLISPHMSHDRAAIRPRSSNDQTTIERRSDHYCVTIGPRSRVDWWSFSIQPSDGNLRLVMRPRCPQPVDTMPWFTNMIGFNFHPLIFNRTVIKHPRVAPSYAKIMMDHHRSMKPHSARDTVDRFT